MDDGCGVSEGVMHRTALGCAWLLAAASCRTVGDGPPQQSPAGNTVPPAAVEAKLSPATTASCAPPRQPPTARLFLQRSMCYGMCPDYTIEVHGDGQAIYEGRNFVRVRGRHGFRIPQAQVDALFAEAACAHPETWKSEYTWPVTDNPTATVTVDLTGGGSPAVIVRDYPPCHETHDGNDTPAAVCQLEKDIDATSGSAAWVDCTSPDGGETYCSR